MNNLYTADGWPNIEYIDSLGCWCNILISARQVGKTFSTLKYIMENDRQLLFTRRTKHELKSISSSMILNPFEKLSRVGINAMLTGSPDESMEINEYIIEDKKRKPTDKLYGIATSLTEIATVRGFNGDVFTDWVFDEFIPEKIVITRKAEGDAFLNAHVTVNSNRELEGQDPIKLWLLANTNNINSPILDALNIVDDILFMRRKGLEELKTWDGVFIGQLKAEKIIEKRKETVLMRRISKDSDFYGMAIDNNWAYDESPYIKTLSIKNMLPAWNYNNIIYCWQRPGGYYICRAPFKGGDRYKGTRPDKERLAMEYSIMKPYYYAGEVFFSDLKTLSLFKDIFTIN